MHHIFDTELSVKASVMLVPLVTFVIFIYGMLLKLHILCIWSVCDMQELCCYVHPAGAFLNSLNVCLTLAPSS